MLTRAAIVLLVVLNLGAGAWWWLHAPPAPEPPPAPPPGAARLHLADASTAAAVPASTPSTAAPTSAPPANAPPENAPLAATASQVPVPATVDSDGACEGGEGPAAGWRVYLPRLPSADAAQAIAARIGEAGFSDYLVVRDGADANTIALGRYGSEDAARRRSAALRAAGFPARCARIPPATPA